MFDIGDNIVYGSNGVCTIMNVGPLSFGGVSQDRLYYTLKPRYIKRSEIFSPTENNTMVMRKVMTKTEADDFVKTIPEVQPLEIVDDKRRDQEYKQAVMTCDPGTVVSLMKTIRIRMDERIAEGKKVTAFDSKYYHIAEDSLYGELAISLEIEKDEVKDYIVDMIGETVSF